MYAIKDRDTELYVSTRPYRLAQIEYARLYESAEMAKLSINNVVNQLAWSYLEKKFNKDRWNIEIEFLDLANAISLFSNMEVVEVNINESS